MRLHSFNSLKVKGMVVHFDETYTVDKEMRTKRALHHKLRAVLKLSIFLFKCLNKG